MSVIDGSLFVDIAKFHKPEHHANTAVIVIDEIDRKWASETVDNWIIRMESQQKTLRFCKKLGLLTIVVHHHKLTYPKHIYDVIKKPDFSCIKRFAGVLDVMTEPPLLPFLKEKEITSLVVMGGKYSMCVRESLMGSYGHFGSSGLLNHNITVLTSPSLLASYRPEIYPLVPKFFASACSFNNEEDNYNDDVQWPIYTLHKGMRIYTRICE